MGSFFIPMAVMVYVYVRISCVVAARHDHMTEIEVHKVNNQINNNWSQLISLYDIYFTFSLPVDVHFYAIIKIKTEA